MRYKLFFVFVCLAFGLRAAVPVQQEFDRDAFYAAMASESLDQVNAELTVLRSSSVKEKEAYEGALLMKKAGLLKIPTEKLKAFKAGRMKLDPALAADADNVEYHFLRLMIQEHAPRLVKYYKDIETDKEYIHKGYRSLSPVIQKAILDYTKASKVLQRDDL